MPCLYASIGGNYDEELKQYEKNQKNNESSLNEYYINSNNFKLGGNENE